MHTQHTFSAQFNDALNKRLEHYRQLKIGSVIVSTPYAINKWGAYLSTLLEKVDIDRQKVGQVQQLFKDKAVPYGWHRGKGTPEQLEDATLQLLEHFGYNPKHLSSAWVVSFMREVGLGIDCSGLIFNLLHYAYSQVGLEGDFLTSWPWTDATSSGSHVGWYIALCSGLAPA